ncbi:MAG: nucleotidyl transferase AbiEii/AbiGii toxin family protein [Bacteroidales bacterium]|nr:nucleotidyl transferase AbiEii/AbiGii toxin family protein [Bacteroidales bacterium]
MFKEILSREQTEITPLLKSFRKDFYLAGGTAIALHLGHRRSIDFDLFRENTLKTHKIIKTIEGFGKPYLVTRNTSEQLNLVVNGVNVTFLEYPFQVAATQQVNDFARLPDLLTLAAMKSYALGRRSKWKDYVDLYFLLKDHFSIQQISSRADEIFKQLFSEKLFRAQLSFFDDVDYREVVDFMPGYQVSEEIIKARLVEWATEF